MFVRLAAVLVLAVCAALFGCGSKPEAPSKPKKPPVARPAPPPPPPMVPANAYPGIPAALAALRQSIDADTIPEIRKAETWLAQQGGAAVVPVADEVAKSENREAYRLACCRVLTAIGAPALAELQAAAECDAPLVKMRAAEGLGQIRPHAPRSIEILIKMLDDPDGRVRQSSIQSLERIGEPAKAATEKLNAILNSDANEVERDRAKKALKSVNPRHKFFD